MTVASRMTRAFCRDRGLAQASGPLVKVHPTLKVPLWVREAPRFNLVVSDPWCWELQSLVFTSVWVIIFGLICEWFRHRRCSKVRH